VANPQPGATPEIVVTMLLPGAEGDCAV